MEIELKKQIIELDQKLLQERADLQLAKFDKKNELEELEESIKKFEIENQKFNVHKKELTKRFLINIIEIGTVLGLTAAGLNIFSIGTKALYIGIGVIYGLVNTILYGILKDEINDYKKRVGEEYFNQDSLQALEENKEIQSNKLKKIEKKLDMNTRKLDEIYNISVNGIVSYQKNNTYLSEDKTVKTKQKKIEKR